VPTPLGHALGGLATAWFSSAISGPANPKVRHGSAKLALGCVVAAVSPDIDILFHSHRTFTHSIGAAAIVGGAVWIAARLSRQPADRARAASVALTVAAAYATHIVLDLLGKDTAPPFGLTALWPFSSRFYLSGADLFMEISRRYWKPDEFILGNLKAGAWELLVLGPVAAIAWYLNSRRRAVPRAEG
jgi:membrane-bound metal-dependent hydrolase YbcI (DUF457 family)